MSEIPPAAEWEPITADHIRMLGRPTNNDLMLVRHSDGALRVMLMPTYRVIVTAADLESRAFKCREPERQAEIANELERYLEAEDDHA